MHIAVLGTTGGTGRQFVQQAIDVGHTVSALVRDPSRLETRYEDMDVVTGDMLDRGSVQTVVKGADAVVSAIGSGTMGPGNAYTEAARLLVSAMNECGVSRVVSVAALGTDRSDRNIPLIGRLVMGIVLKHVLTDMKHMEEVFEASNLNWTVMWPPRLTDGALTGEYRASIDCALKRGAQISRADLAHSMLHILGDETTFGHKIAIAY